MLRTVASTEYVVYRFYMLLFWGILGLFYKMVRKMRRTRKNFLKQSILDDWISKFVRRPYIFYLVVPPKNKSLPDAFCVWNIKFTVFDYGCLYDWELNLSSFTIFWSLFKHMIFFLFFCFLFSFWFIRQIELHISGMKFLRTYE